MSKTANYLARAPATDRPVFSGDRSRGFLSLQRSGRQDQLLARWSRGELCRGRSGSFGILSALLKAAGKSFDHVARAGVYLTNMSDSAR